MGLEIGTAVVLASLIGGGAAVGASALSKQKGGRQKLVQTPDARKTTKKDVSKKGARAALVAGTDSQGILTSAPTSGRGTLLNN